MVHEGRPLCVFVFDSKLRPVEVNGSGNKPSVSMQKEEHWVVELSTCKTKNGGKYLMPSHTHIHKRIEIILLRIAHYTHSAEQLKERQVKLRAKCPRQVERNGNSSD